MAFTGSFKCTEGKKAIMAGYFAKADTWKVALFKSSAALTAATTSYTAVSGVEITGTGYTAGGKDLTRSVAVKSTTQVYIDFADVSWTSATFTAYGALIYDDTITAKTVSGGDAIDLAAKPAFAVIDFGGARTVSGGTFTLSWPDPTTTTPIIVID